MGLRGLEVVPLPSLHTCCMANSSLTEASSSAGLMAFSTEPTASRRGCCSSRTPNTSLASCSRSAAVDAHAPSKRSKLSSYMPSQP